jgi:acetyl-CoA C-acetyltransferase
MTRMSVAEKLGLTPVARIVATPRTRTSLRFTTAPVFAMQKVLARAGWSVGDVDLFEVNEAFAAVAMIAMQELGLARRGQRQRRRLRARPSDRRHRRARISPP